MTGNSALFALVLGLALMLVLGLAACVSPLGPGPGPGPGPALPTLSQKSTLEGSGIIGSIMIPGVLGPFPVTYPVKWHGSGSLLLQFPATPHVVIEGNLVVEPVAPYITEGEQQVRDGRMLILSSDGHALGLAPVGTIKENP